MAVNRVVFPKLITAEVPQPKEVIAPFMGAVNAPQAVDKFYEYSAKGAVVEGKWAFDPGWMLEHPSEGVYKITHGLGYTNLSINISLLQSPGTIHVKEFHPTYFIVETSLDREPKDLNFMFSVSRVVQPK